MPYEVKLQVYEGPIELLLHLITKQRVDIYEVSLATITEEFLAALDGMEELDLESATGFLVVAATLLELKSARLLPASRGDELDPYLLEQRDLLLARLVECATFREAGSWLAARLREGEDYHGRSAALEEPYARLAPDLLKGVSPRELAVAAAGALAPRVQRRLDLSHVAPITASVRSAVETVSGRLRAGGWLSFERLCEGSGSRIDVVVRFLALLELYKAGAVDLDQAMSFGELRARWTEAVSVDAVLQDTEEYTIDVGGGR